MQSDDIDKRKKGTASGLVIESDEVCCDKVGKDARESSPDVDDEIIFVPSNPKTWSEKNIETWIKWAARKFELEPPLDASRIPKDAAELATFNKAEFFIACGSFEGGRKLAQHYRYMMENAHEECEATLRAEGDPG